MSTSTEMLLAQEAERLRGPLLAAHRGAAPREDLEDLYAQSVLELLLRVRRDPSFATREHLANALRLRFASRLTDHHRALSGRSPGKAAAAHAERLDDPLEPQIAATDDVASEVLLREQTRELLSALRTLPPAQRDALLAEAAGRERPASWAESKRRSRGRRALRQRLR
jgi:DNA-directed RNA polymerase specialized sigma24 family protein